MILAAYMVAGFLVASIYAVGMLQGPPRPPAPARAADPADVALIATPIQLFVGDTAARAVADHQPAKFAGMECIQETGTDQTEYIGGICTDDGVKGAIGIPGLDSFLVGFSTDTEVTGLDDIPADERPPANTLLHLSFDAMVGIGIGAAGARRLARLGLVAKRRDIPQTPWFLRAVAVSGAARSWRSGAGWIVTEVGRQPWIVQGYMRTAEAVTEAKGIWFAFAGVLLLYAALGTTAILVLRAMSRRWREGGAEDVETPYAPPARR